MEDQTVQEERDFFAWCLQQPAIAGHKLVHQRPNFLIISPGKTGSSWLADKLGRHPQIFIPPMKEVRYFSAFFKSLDLDWYLDQFAPAEGRRKGDASPTYALLPAKRIRLLCRLMPDVKLVFLMREPMARAWSHAKHCQRFREANFVATTEDFAAVTDQEWSDNLEHNWPLAHGDYLGQLRRWMSVFPREQMYVGFYETIARQPEALLRDLFAFLGVNPHVDLSSFAVTERVLKGQPGELPPELARSLHELLHDRTRELAAYLQEQFQLTLPPEWDAILKSDSCAARVRPAIFRHEADDQYLSWIVEQEENYASKSWVVRRDYRGYDIVFSRGLLYAFVQHLGPFQSFANDEAKLQRCLADGRCFVAATLLEVKKYVDEHACQPPLKVRSKPRQQFDRFMQRMKRGAHSWRLSMPLVLQKIWLRLRAS